MTTLTRYQVLYASLTSRRRRPTAHTGLDRLAGRLALKLRTARLTQQSLRRDAQLVAAQSAELKTWSNAVLDQRTQEMREVFRRGRQDHDAVRRAMALVREVARRETGEEAYIVQLMGALALYHGRVIEMVTGEGKTLTGSLAAPLIAWQRKHLHVFTVNDYLAARDAASRAPIFNRCGLTCGAIVHETEPKERFEIYSRPIVFGTPKQITADWLRDQIRLGRLTTAWAARRAASELPPGADAALLPMIPGLHACLVDEADAVLIDEGVTPLIIARSRREDELAPVYTQAARIAAKLDEGPDFSIDHLRRRADLKRRGRDRAAAMWGELTDPIWRGDRRAEELVRQALVAAHCYHGGRQYQVVDGRVVIVDEYTGRFLPDRSWEHGLHQAVEAKEGLTVTADRETLARMSFQRFFRSYPFLCGMTGTAADATVEIEGLYSHAVLPIPTNRPLARTPMPARAFRSAAAKWEAIADSIIHMHRLGRPVLVGTRSIAASEHLSRLLESRAVEHKVLNANFDKHEAEVIALAGHSGAVTVATNMAGRGTDIRLDDRARDAGGLHVILTEMHTALRIDRQFIGRAGRQGDPGSSQIFIALDDELVRLFTPRLAALAAARASSEELASSPLLRGLFRLAQSRAEARGRRNREAVLRQDDWIEKHLPGA